MNAVHPYQHLDDKALAELYRTTANQQVLAMLFGRYRGLLLGVCMKYLQDAEAAADACNDIYLELVEKLLKHTVENPKAWLHTVARNHCLMKLRGDKKMATGPFQESFVQNTIIWHPDDAPVVKEAGLQAMELCVEQLKNEQQQMIRLFYLEQKSYQEIAEQTGQPWNKIRSHIQNGRRNLKICMENTHEHHGAT